MSLIVAVGSTNPAKTGAVTAIFAQAFPTARVVPVEVPSGVREQPLGAAETRRGAEQRARGALAAVAGARFGIGLEGGVEPESGDLINCCAVAGPDRLTHAWGVRFALPPAVAAAVRAGAELGPVMDELSGIPASKRKLGAVGILTNGLLTREQMWQPALACALAPHLHPELYPELYLAAGETGAAPAGGTGAAGRPGTPTRDFAVSTFVVHQGRVLLLYHRKLQMWLPPGGHIEPHELPDEAAVREVLEETGLAVELVSAPVVTGVPGPRPLARPEGLQLEEISPGHQHVDLIYFARPVGSVELRLNPGEGEAVGWYTREQFANLERMTAEVRFWARRALEAVSP